jgi:nucleoside-diphosphate-sugar epimerase
VDVYRKPAPQYPISEESPRGADHRFSYAANKVAIEEELERAAASGAFELTIVRPAATYNDQSTPIGILNSGLAVMRRIRQGLPVIVLGDGLSLWTSSHRDDVGRAIAMAAGNHTAYGKAYTISGNEAITWLQYYGAIAEAMKAPDIEFVGIPSRLLAQAAPKTCEWCELNFQYDNVFDNAKARKDLDYHYTVSWAEGVARMVSYQDSIGAIDASSDNPSYNSLVSRIFLTILISIKSFLI